MLLISPNYIDWVNNQRLPRDLTKVTHVHLSLYFGPSKVKVIIHAFVIADIKKFSRDTDERNFIT